MCKGSLPSSMCPRKHLSYRFQAHSLTCSHTLLKFQTWNGHDQRMHYESAGLWNLKFLSEEIRRSSECKKPHLDCLQQRRTVMRWTVWVEKRVEKLWWGIKLRKVLYKVTVTFISAYGPHAGLMMDTNLLESCDASHLPECSTNFRKPTSWLTTFLSETGIERRLSMPSPFPLRNVQLKS